MSILDKKHILTINLDDSSIEYSNKIKFYNTDKNISNLYVKIKKTNNDEVTVDLTETDLAGLTLKLTVVKPKTNQTQDMTGVLTKELVDYTCAIYKFDLPVEFTNQVGFVYGEFELTDGLENGESMTIDPFSYEIKASKLTGLNTEIETNPDLPVLKQLIKEVKETAQTVNNIDNTNVSDIKTYSNKKIEEKFSTVSTQIKDKANLNNIEKHIYVTNFGDDITGDGSETNPFATIQKAIDSIDVLTKKDIIVHVSDGIYNTSSEFDEWGRDVLTNLTGKNYSSKRTSNTDLQNKYGKLIIEGNGVNTILDGDNKSKRIGIYAHCNTDVVIKNINFKNFVSGVASHEFSVVTVKGCTFENCTNGILAENMAKVEAGYNTFINCENDFYSKNGQIQNNYSTHNNSVCVVSSEGSPYHLLSKLTCNNVKSFLKNKGDGYIQVNDSNFVGDNTNDFYEGIANYLYLNRCKISKFSTVFDARGGKVEVVSCNIFNNGFVVYNTIGNADIMFSNCNSNNESGVEIPNTQATPFRINNHTTLQFSGTNTIKPYKVLYNPPSDSMFLYGSSIPSTGYHFKGKVCFNTAPVSGQPIGWVCSVAGEPGTWLPLPNLG